jgi:hypothetical protein
MRRLSFLVVLSLLAACSGENVVPGPAADVVVDTGSVDTGKKVDTGAAKDGKPADTATPDVPVAEDVPEDVAADADDAVTEPDATPDGSGDDAGGDDAVADVNAGDAPADAAEDGGETSDDSASTDGGTPADGGSLPPVTKGTYPLACQTTADCGAIPCGKGVCVAGKCDLKPIAGQDACLIPLGADQVQCLPAGAASDAAACLVCNPKVSQVKLSSVTAADPIDCVCNGIAVADEAKGGVSWVIDGKRSVSGGKSLYFGDPVKRTYATGKQVAATVTLPKLQLPAGAGLKPRIAFWLWLATEETVGHDVLSVSVTADGVSKVVWTSDALPLPGTTKKNPKGEPVWQEISVDASAWAGKSVTVNVTFDSGDGKLNGFEGAYFDDLGVDTGCCTGATDCDDGNACTTDACGGSASAPACTHEVKANCCDSAKDCDDGKVCTLDLCPKAGGSCNHAPLPGCCETAQECDDGDNCTADGCDAASHVCTHASTCCKSNADCPSTECDTYTCQAGLCVLGPTKCCNADGECDDQDNCTIDVCKAGKCGYLASTAPGCCPPQPLNTAFNGSTDGWSSQPAKNNLDWHYKEMSNAKSAPGVLHFGYADGKAISFPNGAPVTTQVVADGPSVLLLPGKDATLTFQAWLDMTVGFNATAQLRLFTIHNGVEVTLLTVQASQAKSGWTPFTVDLSPAAGSTLPLKFEAKLVSSQFSTLSGSGFHIDDVQVNSNCAPKKCTAAANCSNGNFGCLAGSCTNGECGYSNGCCGGDSECNDGNVCTADKCVAGKCQFAPIAGCCVGDNDCNDNNPCTLNKCPGAGGQCAYPAIAGCCLGDKDCDDKNTCTTDSCSANVCKNLQSCCKSDAECNDKDDKCTTDACVNGACVYKQTNAPGCCVPEVFVAGFDDGDPKGFTFNNSAGASNGWQAWGAAGNNAKVPPGALYYGNTSKLNYDFGANNGTATSAVINLPAATPSSLSLWLWMETEGGSSYDNLTIDVVSPSGGKTNVFNKNTPGFQMQQWYNVKADLSAFQGKPIQLVLTFNTGDGIANSTKGVFVDDIQVITKCGP